MHITEEETNPLSVYQKDWCLALVNLESKESKTIAPRTPQQNVASQQLRGLDKGESYNTKSHAEAQQMDLAIANLLAKGAVREVQSQEDQFTSTLFLVQKENGEFRPVIISSGAKSIPRKGVLQNERTTGCNLHRRHAATSSTEPGVANTVCAGGSLSGKSGLPGQDGEMLSCSIPVYCLSRGPVVLDNSDTFSPSAKAKQYFGGLSTPPRTSCTALQPTWRRRRSCVLPQSY